jgi:hypothetical protein
LNKNFITNETKITCLLLADNKMTIINSEDQPQKGEYKLWKVTNDFNLISALP